MKKWLSYGALAAVLVSPYAYAKEISLHQQPDAKAKVVAKVKDQANVVIIFQPEKGDWLKVGDMTNGNVGWIKLEDMDDNQEDPAPEPVPADANTPKPTSSLPYHKKIVKRSKDKNGGERVQVIEYQGTHNLSQAEIQDMMSRMEQRQRVMQHSLDRMMRSMMIDFDQFGMSEDGIDDPIFDMPKTGSAAAPANQKHDQSWWESLKAKLNKSS